MSTNVAYLRHVATNGPVIADGTGPNSSVTPQADGVYTLNVSATDKDGLPGTNSIAVAVNNVSSKTTSVPGFSVGAGSAVTLLGTFSDPGRATRSRTAGRCSPPTVV